MASSIAFEIVTPGPAVLQSIVDEAPEALTAVGLLMLGIGLLNVYLHRSKKATADRLQEAPVTDVGSITEGPVAVTGVARPAGETLDRPASGGECLAFERRTRTTRQTVDRNQGEGEQREVSFDTTTSSSSTSTAFYVADDTGTVLVSDDETPTLHLERSDSATETPDPDESGENRGRLSTDESYSYVSERDHTYSELFPGDEVFVYGRARRRAPGDGDDGESEAGLSITGDPESGDLIVTHHDRDWLIDTYQDNVQLLIGLVVSALSLAFIAFIWVS